MATLPPPPVNDKMGSFAWLEWYRQLRNYVSTSGSVPWYIINFAGSNITDIALRAHDNLQGLQGGSAGQHYHITQAQHSAIANYLELVDLTASVSIPTTPTIFKLPTIVGNNGVDYDTSTGVITYNNGGTYEFNFLMNAISSASNKTIYFYAEKYNGSTWEPIVNSGRSAYLSNASVDDQRVFVSTNYFPAGTQIRIYLWESTGSISLDTIDVPDITPGAAKIPAARLLITGAL